MAKYASVIVPTYNRAYILKYCLQNILSQSITDYEVICIDDASEDDTTDIISSIQHPASSINYIRLEKQVGPYVARNIGIKEAKGELIIFIDSDVLVHSRFVEDHLRIHHKADNIVLQGMVHHTRKIPSLNFRFFYPNALCFNTFITQNVSVRKEWLDKAGGFDSFGALMGYKDVEMGVKLRRLGLKWAYAIKSCKAYHIDGPASKENLKAFFNKCTKQGESAYFFVQKYGEIAEKYAHTRKAVFIANLLQTDKWVEQNKTLRFLESSRDNPLPFGFHILKGIMRYHYRAKGIKKHQTTDNRKSIIV